jgi:glycosyltransferase involved in cell wall biosynthesis
MLIVFSGNTSWSMYNFRLGMMKKLMLHGYDVCVVAPEDEYTQIIKEAGVQFIPIKKLKRSGINPIEDYLLLREYFRIYKALKPGLIFHYTIKPNIYGSFAAKYCQIPSISITTGLGNAFSKKGLLFYIAKYLYKRSSIHAREVWFLNSSDKQIFVENGIIPIEKGFILPGEGIDMNLFKQEESEEINKSSIVFLLVSRMLYDKGVEIFVKATEILVKKGYKISSLLLGRIDEENPEGIPKETLSDWQNKRLVRYLGATDDVKPFIRNSDCVVLPSYYKEGIPRVLLEAACMEKPIITTYNPGCLELVDDGINGYLCKTEDVLDLSEKMEKFIHLSLLEKIAMGKAGRKKMETNFDEKIIVDIYLDKCRQLLSNN